MNKQLMLAIILVSMIPGIVVLTNSISGFLIADTSKIQLTETFTTSGFAMFFLGAAVLLVVAVLYLINMYKSDNKKSTTKISNIKIIKKTHTAEKKARFHKLFNDLKALTNKIKFAKIDNNKAEKYIVFVVGIVAVVGILVMILR